MATIPAGSSPFAGSSSTRSWGSESNAAAIARRWRIPVEYPRTLSDARSRSPTRSSTSSTRPGRGRAPVDPITRRLSRPDRYG